MQKVKLASLPADTKILRDLARLHAEEIALDIVAQLQNPERRYLDAANGLKADGQMKAAAQELAKAVMILEAKKKPIDEEMKNLKQLALQVK